MRAQLLADHDRDITIEIRLFAGIAQEIGCRSIQLTIPNECDFGGVEEQLVKLYPQLEKWLAISRWAMRDRFIDAKELTVDSRVIDLIPPVSGG